MNPEHGQDPGASAEQLAALIAAMGRPPMVTAYEVLPDGDSPAALLAWGRTPNGWVAGVCFVYSVWRGGPIRALVTIWLPHAQVERRRAETYLNVPRVALAGIDPEQWPRLPPVYPNASGEWVEAHHHAVRVDPARRYGLRPTPSSRRRH